MHDVVIIGGGNAGMAVARAWEKAGLKVIVVEECCAKPEWWHGEWVQGRGTVASQGLVTVLDQATADERRILPCKTVVVAIGRMDALSHTSRMLGITKLGAEFSEDKTRILTDEKGRTRAPGVYAAGSCASSVTPHIVEDVIRHCTESHKNAGVAG